jgi:hypothetical protein
MQLQNHGPGQIGTKIPLTLTLSHREREEQRASLPNVQIVGFGGRLATIPPLRLGAGRGEEMSEDQTHAFRMSQVLTNCVRPT